MKCKIVQAPFSNQSLKALLYIAFKPVAIQFYTNRCHTRSKHRKLVKLIFLRTSLVIIQKHENVRTE